MFRVKFHECVIDEFLNISGSTILLEELLPTGQIYCDLHVVVAFEHIRDLNLIG